MFFAALVGCGLAAHANNGVIDIPGAKIAGEFRKSPTPFAYGDVGHGAFGTVLEIYGKLENGDTIGIHVTDPAGTLETKIPGTYPIADHENPGAKFMHAPRATLEYNGFAYCVSKEGGTLTLSALGKKDGPITGSLQGVVWSTDNPDCKKLGSKGSFSVQRAVDR